MSGARPLYAVLDIPADASSEAVKLAYRRLALQHHPDKCRGAEGESASNETFARIAFAYEVLGNEQRRKRYDLTGEMPQNDAAVGRSANETFLAEYVKAAPKSVRVACQADMSLHSLDNYEVLEVDGRDVPSYMRGIVSQGLGYLVSVVDGMEKREVVLLRHYVMDQMYALLAYEPPLDKEAFEERGYIITYYDNPLQAGIEASWSDQNDSRQRRADVKRHASAEMRTIDAATVEQRKLVALEWHGGAAPAQAVTAPAAIPGEGDTPERLRLAIRALVQSKRDVGSFTVHQLRRELEQMLGLEPHALDSKGAMSLMSIVLEEQGEDEEEDGLED